MFCAPQFGQSKASYHFSSGVLPKMEAIPVRPSSLAT